MFLAFPLFCASKINGIFFSGNDRNERVRFSKQGGVVVIFFDFEGLNLPQSRVGSLYWAQN